MLNEYNDAPDKGIRTLCMEAASFTVKKRVVSMVPTYQGDFTTHHYITLICTATVMYMYLVDVV